MTEALAMTAPALHLVAPSRVAELWPFAIGNIQRALDWGDGEFTADDLLEGLIDGKMQLWLSHRDHVVDAVCVTQIVTYPRVRSCIVLLVGGEPGAGLAAVRHGVATIEDFARRAGCDALELVGRQGWERVLPIGWEKRAILMRKELRDGR